VAFHLRQLRDPRPSPVKPGFAAGTTFLVLSVVYALSNHPWVASGDSAEFQVMSAVGGIAHAGYPTFVLALEAIGRLPWSTFAARANLLCGLAGALAGALAAWHGARISGRAWAGIASGIALGLSYQVWQSATVAEIYAFTLALAAVLFHLSWGLAQRPGAPRALAIGILGGLGIGAHLTVVALAPVVLVALAVSRRVRPLRAGVVLALLGGFGLGLAPLGYMMSQDRPDHPMNYLALKRLPEEPASVPTLAERASHVVYLLSGKQYLGSHGDVRGMRGTLVRFRYLFLDFVLNAFFGLGSVLAALGAWLLWRRKGLDALLLGTWAAGSVFLIWYAAVSPDIAATYFIYATWILAVGMSLALAWLSARSRLLGAAAALCLLAAPFVRLALPQDLGTGWFAIAWHRLPAEWTPFAPDRSWDAYDRGVLGALPPQALLLGNWNELMTFKYAKHALGLRPDVDLLLTELPRELVRDTPRARATGRPVFTTLPYAPTTALPGTRVREAGRWARGGLWELQSTAADSMGAGAR
jgi:hypothetical protein